MMPRSLFASAVLACLLVPPLFAQTAQGGVRAQKSSPDKLRVEYVHYRPARWETERVQELVSEHPNRGGLVYIYYTNVSEEPVRLRYWRANGKDESYWRLNHFVAWDRAWRETVEPGQLGILEINAVSREFAPGRPLEFSCVDDAWLPVTSYECALREDPVQLSCIRVLPEMNGIEVHVRYTGTESIRFESLEVIGEKTASVEWTTQQLDGHGYAIARLRIDGSFESLQMTVARLCVKAGNEARAVYAHRRAFPDVFPIGTWSNGPETFDALHRLHIDTMVAGGGTDAPFFADAVPKYGFRAMVHTGIPVNVDTLRAFAGHPSVVCWMLQDEPDWSIAPNIMEFADRTVRHYDSTKPTFITLCRNTQFFEYAPIPDIACQDHYSVTAPSSSKWPKFYGTRLEETAWYTRDLKRAAEPKPIWIWSQAIADWSERPKRPVPTPEELAVQLVLNLGRGAKGILWFNHDRAIAEKFPDAVEAMRGWGRVMTVLRDDFLASEPVALETQAPEKVDVAPLLNWDALILCVANLDYEIHPEAYPFADKTDVQLGVPLPPWLRPGAALRIGPGGIEALPLNVIEGRAEIGLGPLHDCAVVVIHNAPGAAARYEKAFRQAVAEE